MYYFIFFLLSFVLVHSNFNSRYPDALRCGEGINFGAIYFAHQIGNFVWYCQIYAGQDRCVSFYDYGSYRDGMGHLGSRNGCTGKSLDQLKNEGRSFVITNGNIEQELIDLKSELVDLKVKMAKMEELISQKFPQFQQKVLANIKKNGLEIGSRWKIQQESTDFVVRDVEGSILKDSRFLGRAGSYKEF